jgi:hypothetical protein
MSSADYRLACIALLKQLRSGIRGRLAAVTWPSRASPQPTPAQETTQASAPPAMPLQAPAVTEDALAQAVAHLEYLGYEVGLEASGWRYARHPYRYHFHLQAFAHGIRLHCGAGIGASMGNSRAAWLDFLNGANDRSHVVRFSLVEGKDGLYHIRMRALVTGDYSRSVFAMVMDMWHDDVDIVRRRPEFPPEIPAGESKDAAAVTVN